MPFGNGGNDRAGSIRDPARVANGEEFAGRWFMVDGASSVNTQIQQPGVQDVQRIQPTPEQGRGPAEAKSRSEVENQAPELAAGRGQSKDGMDLSDVNAEQLIEIKDSLNQALSPINVALDFEERKEVEDIVVKVMNKETEEVIRQIPPEAMLKMAQRIQEMTGLLVDTWR